jgi:hypothetical protein
MFFPTTELNQFTYLSLPSGLTHGSITTTVFFNHSFVFVFDGSINAHIVIIAASDEDVSLPCTL